MLNTSEPEPNHPGSEAKTVEGVTPPAVGTVGVTATPLRPWGRVLVEDRVVEAKVAVGMLAK